MKQADRKEYRNLARIKIIVPQLPEMPVLLPADGGAIAPPLRVVNIIKSGTADQAVPLFLYEWVIVCYKQASGEICISLWLFLLLLCTFPYAFPVFPPVLSCISPCFPLLFCVSGGSRLPFLHPGGWTGYCWRFSRRAASSMLMRRVPCVATTNASRYELLLRRRLQAFCASV